MTMNSKQKLTDTFSTLFGVLPQVTAYAPGRVEIIGNHTDYNQGVVLSAAIDRGTFFAVAPELETTNDLCTVHDLRSDQRAEFALAELKNPRPGDWANYIKGIIVELQQRGISIPPFKAAILSSIPLAAGMSSSAALEMSAALALTEMTGCRLSKLELARLGQGCENNYIGARTGLLDQLTSLHGRKGHFVFSDFRSLSVETIPAPSEICLVVANTMVKHNLTGAYNERRSRCEEAAKILAEHIPEVRALRDVTSLQLEQFREYLDITTYRRALHVISENERVFGAVQALQEKNIANLGLLLFASHDSSRYNFANSCPELDAMVEIGKSLPGIIGGRLSGGGFGGITVHLVAEDEADNFARRLAAAWYSRTGTKIQPIVCSLAEGASA